MIELLAPAGNEKSFLAAINNGADAVYLGLSAFSARRNAENFTFDNINYYVSYAHLFGVKVYVAINTLVKDSEKEDFFTAVKIAYEACADAFILQDAFLADELFTAFPDIVLHLSTQGGVNNIEGAEFAKKKGFSRVILARETPLSEIKKIAAVIETEIFVHGALCSSFSGHCYFSSFVGGNSGNRGLCKQPCRKKYYIETKSGDGQYSISLSDLNLAERIDEIKAAGVASVKIEGRMRTPEYVASAVRLYRSAIDGKPFNFDEIKREFNRGDYTTGYLDYVDKNIISDKIQSHTGEKVGKVKKLVGKDVCLVDSRENFVAGDGFKILRHGSEVGNAISERDGNELTYTGKISVGDDVYITKDEKLNAKLNDIVKFYPITVTAKALTGEKLELSAEGVTVYSETVLEKAKTSAVTIAEITNNLLKIDKFPFKIRANVEVSGEPFIPKAQLNRLRAELYAKIFNRDKKPKRVDNYSIEKIATSGYSRYENIVITDKPIIVKDGDALVYFPQNYDDIPTNLNAAFLYVPSFLGSRETQKIKDISDNFYGFYVDGFNGLKLSEDMKKPFIAGVGLNAFNSCDIDELYDLGAQAVVFSQELSLNEISATGRDGNIFSLGGIRLMELEYCPFGKHCETCKRGNIFNVKDETGHDFILRRYKISGRCRFELYNGAILYSQVKGKKLVNLITLDDAVGNSILDGDETIKEKIKTTNGNLKRGVN